MRTETEAIVCALRSHGETGAVVRLLTAGLGLQAAYVRGARGRRMRPVLIAGNLVQARLSSRSEVQLPQAEIELVHSRALLHREPLPAAAIEWSCALAAVALPEGQPYPRIHSTLEGLLAAIEAAPSASGWGASLVRYELLVLAELGFGLDLERCAVSNRRDALVAVSPRSGRAVSATAAEPFGAALLPLPRFLAEGGQGDWAQIAEGMRLTGHFLDRHVLIDHRAPVGAARARLVDRLCNAAAPS